MRICCCGISSNTEQQHAPDSTPAITDPACRSWLAQALAVRRWVTLSWPPDLPLADLDARDLEIRRIYLLSRFQGLGVGRWLMEEALACGDGRRQQAGAAGRVLAQREGAGVLRAAWLHAGRYAPVPGRWRTITTTSSCSALL